MKKIFAFFLTFFFILTCFSGCGKKEKISSVKTAYILVQKGDTQSLDIAGAFQMAFENKGGSVIMETFKKDTKDFSKYLQNAKAKNANVVFAPASFSVTEKILKTADELDINCPIMASDSFENNDVLSCLKNTDLEVYYPAIFDVNDSSNKNVKKFVNGFKKFLKSDSDNLSANGGKADVSKYSALGFDAYNVAVAAIKDVVKTKGAEFTSVDIANALWTVKYEKGVTGVISFDRNGDAEKDSGIIKKATENGFEYVTNQTVNNPPVQTIARDYNGINGVNLNVTDKKIVIGVAEPLSGENKYDSSQEILGIKYANSINNKIKIGNDEYTVEISVVDIGSNEEEAKTAVSALVNQNALIMLGSFASDYSEVKNQIENAGIPAVSVFSTDLYLTEGNDLYFRACPINSFQGSVLAEFAYSQIK